MRQYVIRGGREGKERLNLLARVMLPFTSQLLSTAGLGEGMTCLDVGCGGGHVTLLMATRVGPRGRVVGTDIDEQVLNLARYDAAVAQLRNVEFRLADAAEAQGEAVYDLVYARFLLTHLVEPQHCLDQMVKACKPKGLIVIEDIDFSGHFCFPHCAAYEQYVELYQAVVRRNGGDPNIGPKLPGMLLRAGVREVQVSLVQPTHLQGEGKLLAAITMEKIASAVMAAGLATQQDVDWIIDGLQRFAADPATVMSVARVVQTWGVRS